MSWFMHNTGIIDNKLNLVQWLAMIQLINYEWQSNIKEQQQISILCMTQVLLHLVEQYRNYRQQAQPSTVIGNDTTF